MTKEQVQKFIDIEKQNTKYWLDRLIQETDQTTKENCIKAALESSKKWKYWLAYPTV